MVSGGLTPAYPTRPSGAVSCARCWRHADSGVLMLFLRLDKLPSEQVEPRLVVQACVVKRVGEDLGHPDEPRSDVSKKEQVNRPEQQSGPSQDDPRLSQMLEVLTEGMMWREHAEE